MNRPHECIVNAQQPGSGVGVKIINMVIHNCMQGVALWVDATNSEVYGNLISYNGWNAPNDWGHGMYSQNTAPSTRTIRDNIFYANYGYNIQVYGESAHLDNHRIDGNILFWDGAAADPPGGGASITIGGGAGNPTGNVITNNAIYGSNQGGNVDFSRGNASPVITNNLAAYAGTNGGAFYLDNQTGAPVITGNKVYSGLITPSGYASTWPANNWYRWCPDYGGPDAKPTGTWTLVRPNLYEPGRGHVAVFNWSKLDGALAKPESPLAAWLEPEPPFTYALEEFRPQLDLIGITDRRGGFRAGLNDRRQRQHTPEPPSPLFRRHAVQ